MKLRLVLVLISISLNQCTKSPLPSTPTNPPGGSGNSGPFHSYQDLSPVPFASFHYSAVLNNYHAPAAFDFTSTSSHASTLDWNFGDFSGHDNLFNPIHTYTYPGTYSVILTAGYQNIIS